MLRSLFERLRGNNRLTRELSTATASMSGPNVPIESAIANMTRLADSNAFNPNAFSENSSY